ncbi:MAG: zinc ribbon domain-containing protein [Proteobacteria bacterium]|nr:zinc ribbon domain-containing protein [Pseudomonadota bacterium]MBU1387441.1 zinc ribbon domain-containing protein [Pseudomonadota bacterium]MBU1541726.1 zinc ribbon domain-containing protein [Pseudomonadota bacterium]MBU2431280.1 zinc ribbon domain-containing protein [Pseudomonadota bacterium]MBU2482932.1 zinc ribbon domain-containing protein [Pseudomonadota bacterium]
MPIYEYNCNACSNRFETLVIGGDTPKCPSCDSKDLSRLMSACGFISKSSVPGGGAPQIKSSAGASGCGTCSSSNCSSCGIG